MTDLRPYTPPHLPRRGGTTRPFGPTLTTADWPEPYAHWRADKLTVTVTGARVQVQFSRDQPPAPPTWDDPVLVDPGVFTHVGPFGYWRFRSYDPAAPATVYGAAYAE